MMDFNRQLNTTGLRNCHSLFLTDPDNLDHLHTADKWSLLLPSSISYPSRRMPTIKTGRVKFFNSQKGYGFVIPDEPIDGSAEVFVHHTVIHNNGGFKSLAEGEAVEFDLSRGPKGWQATRVTGPNGSYVRGDPYSRMRSMRPMMLASSNSPDSVVNGPIAATGPYYHYAHHFPQASAYSQMLPYNSQMPQPHYGSFTYSSSRNSCNCSSLSPSRRKASSSQASLQRLTNPTSSSSNSSTTATAATRAAADL
ncbi:cold-shock' DNA-binding domain-containing protein [Coemansia spiralis]|nr:cold-shock' DNA-binding domain-containing protein [Coemansia spiralis]